MTTSLHRLRSLSNHNAPQNKRNEVKKIIEQKCRESGLRIAFYEVDIRDGGFMREQLENSNGLYIK